MPRENASLRSTNGASLPENELMSATATDLPHAGIELRTARERLGWALPDVAAMLRIRLSYLEALESGRPSNLPGKVYALGFLRTYAASLGLDPDEIMHRFQLESGDTTRRPELAFPVPMAERGLPAGALILLGLVLVGGAYAGWYRLSGEGKLPAETVTPVPARLATLAEQAIPGPDGRIPVPAMPSLSSLAPSKSDDAGMFEPRQAAAENPLLAPEPPAPPIAERPSIAPAIVATPTTAIAMPVRRPELERRDASTDAAPADTTATDGSRVVLRFTGETWVQVKERGGATLISKIMKAGDIFPVPTRPNLVLTTGNAGRVEVLVDGAVAPAIGAAGSVRKDVPLEADQLKAGVVAPATARR